jgi:hypothetical protein
MIAIILATLFLVVLLGWALWPPGNESDAAGGANAVPSRLVGERICSGNDLQFIAQQAPELRAQFVRERKALMLLWLQMLGRAVASAVRTHRAAASRATAIEPAVELRLALEYTGFLILWRSALLLVWMTNPFTAQFVTSRVTSIGEGLSEAMRELVPNNPSESPDVR